MLHHRRRAVCGPRGLWLFSTAAAAACLALSGVSARAQTGTSTTSTTASPSTGATTSTNAGTTTAGGATSGTQDLNQALLAEEVSLQFYNLNSSKTFLTAATATQPSSTSTAGTTTSGTTAGTTTSGTTSSETTASTTTGGTTAETTTSTTAGGGTTSGTTTGTTTGTTASTTTAPTTSSSDLAALNSMIQEIKAGHQAHVTMLQQMLGTNAQQMPTFQNLDATSLPQFLTMAQTLEDIDVNVHQGVLLRALQSGSLNPLGSTTAGTTTGTTTTGTTTAGTTTAGTTTAGTTTAGTTTTGTAATGDVSGVYALELGILADDARYDGAIRAFSRTIPTAEGGNATGTLSETGTPLGTGFTLDQGNQALQSYIVGASLAARRPRR